MREKIVFPEIHIGTTPSADHRRQMKLQVWLPLIASIVFVLALVILTIVGAVRGSPQIERWGNISAVIVILPVLLAGLLLLGLVGGSAYGLTKLLQKMPGWMLNAQLFILRVALLTRKGADAATKPIFTANNFSARASALWNRYIRRKPVRVPELRTHQ